jgi:hypothetical protein
MYHEKLKLKFNNYKRQLGMVKLLLLSLLENKSMVFKEWSFMNWAMFQDSFMRHLEWFANEGIPGMVDTQIYIQDVPLWWKDQVNLFPFVSSTISYAVYNFLNTSAKTCVNQEIFSAMQLTSDKESIYHLRYQNSYITKQLTQFTYDILESKKFGWYTSSLNGLSIDAGGAESCQVYDNSKIKMEALVCLIVSSVLNHQVKNEASDRKILVGLQRALDNFDDTFQLELEDEMYPVLIAQDKFHWQRPQPFSKLRRYVLDSNNLTDTFVNNLPRTKNFNVRKRLLTRIGKSGKSKKVVK